jgi:hypothetical protein
MSRRGIVNNDPGNIRRSNIKWLGAVPGTDPAFVTFDTPEHGIRALAKILLTYQRQYHLHTIAEIITRFAPSSENDTEAYIADVEQRVGIGRDVAINLEVSTTLGALCDAIIHHEEGEQPYSNKVLMVGVGMAYISSS